AICGACYEVPSAMREEAAAVLPETRARTSWGTPSLDLRAGAVAVLEAAGVPRPAIDADHPCTLEDERFYSYRRHPRTGRFAGVLSRACGVGGAGGPRADTPTTRRAPPQVEETPAVLSVGKGSRALPVLPRSPGQREQQTGRSAMGTWRNAMVALGLANEVDDEYYEDERMRHDEVAAPSRRTERGPEPAPEREAQVTPIRQHSNVVAMAPAVEESMHRITTIHPRSYNDAKAIGESFRDGVPVIMNLSDMQDGDAKRMVDFSAGLVFGLRGTIERVTSKVFLLSPEFVQVDGDTSADEGSFYNQS